MLTRSGCCLLLSPESHMGSRKAACGGVSLAGPHGRPCEKREGLGPLEAPAGGGQGLPTSLMAQAEGA